MTEPLLKLKVEDFSLFHTLECGQFFLYEKINDFYYITHFDIVFKIKQEKNTLFYLGIDERDLIKFFNLDLDLKELTCDFNDEHLLIALEKYWGLRLINQNLFQCIIGFVCSSASNISKIKTNLKLICKNFGEKIVFDDKEFYTFPKIGKMNNLEILKDCKTGYRAKYIYEINNILSSNPKLLNEIQNSDYKTSKELLMKFPGIGSKVSDCICLFALNHNSAFPIDTWVKQIIEKLYLKREAKNMKEIEVFIEEYFDGYRGLKQQYLFHYIRLNNKYL